MRQKWELETFWNAIVWDHWLFHLLVPNVLDLSTFRKAQLLESNLQLLWQWVWDTRNNKKDNTSGVQHSNYHNYTKKTRKKVERRHETWSILKSLRSTWQGCRKASRLQCVLRWLCMWGPFGSSRLKPPVLVPVLLPVAMFGPQGSSSQQPTCQDDCRTAMVRANPDACLPKWPGNWNFMFDLYTESTFILMDLHTSILFNAVYIRMPLFFFFKRLPGCSDGSERLCLPTSLAAVGIQTSMTSNYLTQPDPKGLCSRGHGFGYPKELDEHLNR